MTDLSIPRKMNLVVGFIQEHSRRTGFSPSIREIAVGCGLGLNAVFRYLERLEAQGRVTRIPGQARSLRVVPSSADPDSSQPDGPPGPAAAWCAGRFCPLLADRFDRLCESTIEKGAAS